MKKKWETGEKKSEKKQQTCKKNSQTNVKKWQTGEKVRNFWEKNEKWKHATN